MTPEALESLITIPFVLFGAFYVWCFYTDTKNKELSQELGHQDIAIAKIHRCGYSLNLNSFFSVLPLSLFSSGFL